MKRDLFVIALCFVAGLGGANVQPILTGAGKLIFPENATPATVSASSGALTVAAGGTNQNVNVTPSGSGIVFLNGQSEVLSQLGIGEAPNSAHGLIFGGTITAVGSLARVITAGADVTLKASAGADTLSAILLNPTFNDNAQAGVIHYALNSTSSAQSRFTGNLGVGGTATPGFALDATGDANVSGVYRKGGTAGVGNGSTITVCTGSTCTGATACTLIFNGGIRTGGTCL